MPCKKEQRSTPSLSKLKRRVVNSTGFQKQCMHASWRLTSPRENVWNHLYRKDHEDHIAGKGYSTMTRYNLVHTFLPMPQAIKFRRRKQQWTRNIKKSSKRFQPGSWTKSRVRRRFFSEHKETKRKVHFPTLMDICQLKKCGVRTVNFKSMKAESYCMVTLYKTTPEPAQF